MKLEKIFEAFPPPEFLDIPFAGLSMHDTAIRVIQFGRKGKKIYIAKYAEKVLPPGVITSGQVNNKEELIHVLQTLKKDLDLNYVKISLPEEKAYLFTAKIPIVPENGVKSAVESKIEENVPVPPGELISDYNIIDSSQPDYLRVVVSNMPISVVDVYMEIVTSAGLTPLSLEIESQAITRSLIKPESVETVLIVNYALDKVGLYVVSNRVVHFTSTIQTKGDTETDMDLLSHEIKKLYTYWHTLKENVDRPERKIQEIIVCGENVSDSVIPYLSTHHNTKVLLGNVWVNAFDVNVNVPAITFTDSLKYPASIGFALPSNILL